jgi:hypothetical protein
VNEVKRRTLVCEFLLTLLAFQFALAAELGIKGSQFTVNGKPTFLLGISYYGALGAPKEFILQDLDDIQRYGFNWLRVWATWSAFGKDVSAVDAEGNPREPFLSKLRWLVAECDRRGLIVDITLSRGDGVVGPKRLQTLEAHLRAVRTLVSALKEFRNWYLDLANECNIRDDRFVSLDELRRLREEVKRLDPKRLVTASFAGDMDKETLKEFLLTVQVDFLAIHRPRHAKSPKETGEWTKRYLQWMKELGRIVPLHYQEPFRRGFTKGWEPTADDFWTDLVQARENGAAGWCFHNGDQRHNPPDYLPCRSFDMSQRRLFEQLDEEESTFLRRLISEK